MNKEMTSTTITYKQLEKYICVQGKKFLQYRRLRLSYNSFRLEKGMSVNHASTGNCGLENHHGQN